MKYSEITLRKMNNILNKEFRLCQRVIYYPHKTRGMFTSACRVRITGKPFIKNGEIFINISGFKEAVPAILINRPKIKEEFTRVNDPKYKRWDDSFKHWW